MLKKYDKPSLSFEDQLDQLVQRGLIVDDRLEALHYLSHLNYYRLGAYWLPFEVSRNPHTFVAGTTFRQVLNHYLFDREFRILLMDVIEKIEVSFRTQWAYHISQAYGPQAYLIENTSIVSNVRHLRSSLDELKVSLERTDEVFIRHYSNTYEEEFPPAWVVCEVMSLGLISRFYSNLRSYRVRRDIAATYLVDEGFLEGFMEHLTYVRNACAHHSRLWNRHLSKKMPTLKTKPMGLRDNLNLEDPQAQHRIYNTLVIIRHMLGIISPESNWYNDLSELIDKYQINVKPMGFPDGWKELPSWHGC